MRTTILTLTVLAGVGLFATPSVLAQQAQDDVETQTKLWDSMRAGKWREAIGAYNKLSVRTDRHVFLAAQAHYNLGELDGSARVLDELLRSNEDHLEAIYMLARIRAKQERMGDAKRLLRSSARLGQSVLRDIYAEEDGKLFAQLLRDPDFLVAIMRDSQSGGGGGLSGRDPFQPPLGMRPKRDDGGPTPVRPFDPERVAHLESRIAELLGEFRVISRDPDPDIQMLLRKLAELRGVLAEYAAIDDRSVREKLGGFRREFSDMKGLMQPLQLQLYVADGNQHLRVMARGLRDEAFKDVLERFGRLKELCGQMQAEPLAVFHRNGRSLFLRGRALAERASLHLRASQIPLVITGTVLAVEPQRNTAVIDDRIYEEGDTVVDPDTGEPFEGLTVVRIANQAVTFQLEDLRFVRASKRR